VLYCIRIVFLLVICPSPPPSYVYRYVTRHDVILRFMLSFKIIMSNRCDQEFLFTISTSTLHSSAVMLLVKVRTV